MAMKTRTLRLLAAILALVLSPGLRADESVTAPYKTAAENIELEKDRLSVKAAFVEFQDIPQLASYFKNAYGCAIFPTVGKGGFGVGGAHGKGWVFKRKQLAGSSKMTQLTVGFQVGGQAFGQVIFFEDEAAYKRFTSEGFEFGAQASAAVITEGAQASASTAGGSNANVGRAQAKTNYTDGMAVFTKIKGGLMYEAAIGGQKFTFESLE
jgi:lipid-binding SYLF domain-containing protein